jgi:Fur family zinc uptake transcriptional regulator
MSSFPPPRHDHSRCIKTALTRAESLCLQRGSRLTGLRKQVLACLWQSHQASGAYDILEKINKTAAKKLAPLSVYRALEFLVSEGLAHRIESLNAFVGCPHPQEGHALQFLVCTSCHLVIELEDSATDKALAKAATRHDFTRTRTVVEVVGQCRVCQST